MTSEKANKLAFLLHADDRMSAVLSKAANNANGSFSISLNATPAAKSSIRIELRSWRDLRIVRCLNATPAAKSSIRDYYISLVQEFERVSMPLPQQKAL